MSYVGSMILFRDVANCFPLLSEQLGLLSKNIDSMAWMHAFSMKGSNLVRLQIFFSISLISHRLVNYNFFLDSG